MIYISFFLLLLIGLVFYKMHAIANNELKPKPGLKFVDMVLAQVNNISVFLYERKNEYGTDQSVFYDMCGRYLNPKKFNITKTKLINNGHFFEYSGEERIDPFEDFERQPEDIFEADTKPSNYYVDTIPNNNPYVDKS